MTPPNSKSIRRRLASCLAVLVAVTLLQVAVGVGLQARQHALALRQSLMTDVTAQQMFGDMKHDGIQGDVFRLAAAITAHDAAKQKQTIGDINYDIDSINKSYGFVFDQSYPDALQATVNATVDPQHDYVSKARAVADRLISHPDDYGAAMSAFTASFDHFEKVQEVLAAAIKAERDAGGAEAATNYHLALISAFLTLLAMGATLAWVVRQVRARVLTPLVYLHGELSRMAEGDFTVPINGDPAGDEIAQMGAIACQMRVAVLDKQAGERGQQTVVAAMTAALGHLARHDLEYRIAEEFPPSHARLRDDFNATVIVLMQAIGKVRVGAASLANAIGEISAAADDLSRRNEQQAATLEETAAATSQVTASVAETAADAESVRQAIARTQAEASEGGAVVSQAVAAMAAIEGSAQEIGQIIGVIDGIAFQTNLLALNAGVEAARAGDAGKGFAVVANEVRALAQRSADAARDIKALITNSSTQVAQGVALVGATGEKLTRIAAQIDETTGLIGGIAGNAANQADNLNTINIAMRELDLVTQQNAAMVEQTTAAARHLTQEAAELGTLVKQFRTRDPNRRKPDAGAAGALRAAGLTATVPARAVVASGAGARVPAKAAPAAEPASSPVAGGGVIARLPAPAARPAAAAGGGAAMAAAAVTQDDWSEF